MKQGATTTTYVYDAGGQLAAEYTSTTPPTPPCTTCYLTADHLGSTRVMTDATGRVWSLHDYIPFGEEVPAGVNGRSGSYYPPNALAINDTVTLQFTGKERDVETGLDYFGARYLSSAQGRWTIPDWSARQEAVPYATIEDPQTLNLYAYVRNNPLSNRDTDGHGCPGEGPDCSHVQVKAEVIEKAKIVQNVPLKDESGQAAGKGIGPQGKLLDTVKVDGKVQGDVQLTETNKNTVTVDGKAQSPTLLEGKATTNKNGQFSDTIGDYAKTSGTKADNKRLAQAWNSAAVTSTDVQTLTLTLPSGGVCTATSTRTLTNVGPDGTISKKFTLTTTQPVVAPPQP